MRKMIVFYAWQSDTERKLNSDFIDIALRDAARRITEDSSLGVEVQIDSDTQGVPGIPPVTDTILKKIASSDLFVPDVTFVARTNEEKLVPNPNVMTEFGYALHAKTHAAIMPVMKPRRMATLDLTGPECLSENIILEGTYDMKQTPGDALAPFFNTIFDKSGVRRSDYDLAGT